MRYLRIVTWFGHRVIVLLLHIATNLRQAIPGRFVGRMTLVMMDTMAVFVSARVFALHSTISRQSHGEIRMPTHRLKIALLIESSREYGRGILRGVAAFVRTHGPWSLYFQERSLGGTVPSWLENWQGDGIIARIESPELLDTIERLFIPAVDVRGLLKLPPSVPLVETNDQTVVRLALAHLRERGFGRIAYCGFPGANYSIRRYKFLVEETRKMGMDVDVLKARRREMGWKRRRSKPVGCSTNEK